MRALTLGAFVAGVLTAAVSPASAEVRLTIVDGYVTIDARDATIRQILDEWARVGQTRIVNSDRVTGGPVTLQLTRVPEGAALDILLRSVSGYMAAPRSAPVANASTFDRILVMPPSVAPRVAAQPAAAPQPFTPQLPVAEEIETDDPGGPPGVPNPRGGPIFPGFAPGQFPGGQAPAGNFPQRGPIFPPPQQVPMPVPGAAPPMPGTTPAAPPAVVPGGMPVGVSTPGMVVQPPVQPGQPVQPGTIADQPR
jgi:hypothetical protein